MQSSTDKLKEHAGLLAGAVRDVVVPGADWSDALQMEVDAAYQWVNAADELCDAATRESKLPGADPEKLQKLADMQDYMSTLLEAHTSVLQSWKTD